MEGTLAPTRAPDRHSAPIRLVSPTIQRVVFDIVACGLFVWWFMTGGGFPFYMSERLDNRAKVDKNEGNRIWLKDGHLVVLHGVSFLPTNEVLARALERGVSTGDAGRGERNVSENGISVLVRVANPLVRWDYRVADLESLAIRCNPACVSETVKSSFSNNQEYLTFPARQMRGCLDLQSMGGVYNVHRLLHDQQ